jgi:hypothetical protein
MRFALAYFLVGTMLLGRLPYFCMSSIAILGSVEMPDALVEWCCLLSVYRPPQI